MKMESTKEKKLSFIIRVKQMLDPVLMRLERIDSKIDSKIKITTPRYYRNEDLKRIFGLSNNTIIKYRQTGVLPYTKLGDIFLYDSSRLDQILRDNEIK